MSPDGSESDEPDVSELARTQMAPSALPYPTHASSLSRKPQYPLTESRMGPQDVHSLIPEACECVAFHGKRDSADIINVADLKKREINLDYADKPLEAESFLLLEAEGIGQEEK